MKNLEECKLGKKIKLLRLKFDISQDELARRADVPYSTLAKIERGETKRPSVFIIAKIAKALKTTVEDLLK